MHTLPVGSVPQGPPPRDIKELRGESCLKPALSLRVSRLDRGRMDSLPRGASFRDATDAFYQAAEQTARRGFVPDGPTVGNTRTRPPPQGRRSLRCGYDGPIETCAKGRDVRLILRQHATVDQQCQARGGIETAQGLFGEAGRLEDFPIRTEPGAGHGFQSGIGRFHPSEFHLIKEFGDRIGLGDRRQRTQENLFA